MNAEAGSHARHALAPTGVLRASINLGNPILARLGPDGSPCGISVDLAAKLAQQLNLEVEHIVFDAAAKSFDAVSCGTADVGFFALDPARATQVQFTRPYVLIEGAYMVRQSSHIRTNDEVDQEGLRVVVGGGSAYDLYLTRTLAKAALVRAPTSPAVTETFLAERADVAAGVKQQLELDMTAHGGLRILPGRFMLIEQAMAVASARGRTAAQVVASFVEDAKSSGFVFDAILRHRIPGVGVAP